MIHWFIKKKIQSVSRTCASGVSYYISSSSQKWKSLKFFILQNAFWENMFYLNDLFQTHAPHICLLAPSLVEIDCILIKGESFRISNQTQKAASKEIGFGKLMKVRANGFSHLSFMKKIKLFLMLLKMTSKLNSRYDLIVTNNQFLSTKNI